VIQLLLETGRVEADPEDKRGVTPLSYAAQYDRLEAARLLLRLNSQDGKMKTRRPRSLLKAALKWLNMEDIVEVHHYDHYGNTPLYFAIQSGHVEMVKLLLHHDRGSGFSFNGIYPLKFAVEKGNTELVKLLLTQSKVQFSGLGSSPLAVAAGWGHKDLVEWLLGTGRFDVDSKPLLEASRHGKAPMVKTLLTHCRVNADDKDERGKSSLSLAAREGSPESVRLLLQLGGADVNSVDNGGMTPLHHAAYSGKEEVVKMLLEIEDINPDVRDYRGMTPLHVTAVMNHWKVAALLLATGRVDIESNVGHDSVLSTAQQWGSRKIEKLLLAYMRSGSDN
jgi:ankyrin repeat protein